MARFDTIGQALAAPLGLLYDAPSGSQRRHARRT